MKKNKGKNVLVVAAHPDDEVLGCGATIAKHTANGDRVWVLILGEGIASRKKLSPSQKRKGTELLRSSARSAKRILGVERIILKNFSDNQFDSIPLLKIIHTIEGVIDDFRPTIIYTHHFGDVNIDHQLTKKAVDAAARPTDSSCVDKVLSFEIPSSTEWNFSRENIFKPNVFVDVSGNFVKKIQAMQAYESELRKFPHPRSLEYIEALAKVRGGNVGYKKAEAFELVYQRIDS